jgi:hypothetical protein
MPKPTRATLLMDAAGVSFATTCYANYEPWMGLPIRTTVGPPRRFPHQLAGQLPQFTPEPTWIRIQDREEFAALYLEKVERELGEYPLLKLYDIAYYLRLENKKRRARLVFCCFEAPGVFCHRRGLASWLEQAGLDVPELTPKENNR